MIPIETLLGAVKQAGLKAREMKSPWYVVELGDFAVVIAKTQKVSRVDLRGFTLKHPAVKPLSAARAEKYHLGAVRGQINFRKDDTQVMEAFNTALAQLKVLAQQAEDAAPAPKPTAKRSSKRTQSQQTQSATA